MSKRPAALILVVIAIAFGLIFSVGARFYLTPNRSVKANDWPSGQSVDAATQLLADNQQNWASRIALETTESAQPKFILLYAFPQNEGEAPEYIVYDESDEIAEKRGLHLSFWKQLVGLHEGVSEEMGAIKSIKLQGHYYLIGISYPPYGYKMTRRGKSFVIEQANCSIMPTPLIQGCPDQWRQNDNGELVVNYNHVALPQQRDGSHEFQ